MKLLNRREIETKKPEMTPEQKKTATARVLTVVGVTFVLLVVYFSVSSLVEAGRLAYGWGIGVMVTYMTAFAALLIAYIIYNRAFCAKNLTADMLPSDWSDEKKQTFLDENRKRIEKSKWMLLLIIPFVFVFLAEALYLFLWCDFLENYF